MAKQKGGTDNFKKVIENHLKKKAFADPLFRKDFAKENKNIDDCVTYIINEVQKIGSQGYTDEEVFGMAIHYYSEDDVKVGSKSASGNVVINQHVTLSPEEIEEARKEARESIIKDEKDKILKKGKYKAPKASKDDNVQTLF